MTDRRRINGPPSGTHSLVFASKGGDVADHQQRPLRTRQPKQHRKIFLRTGLTPSASGSAYLELQPSTHTSPTLIPTTSSLKLSCTIHGPKPLPRSAAFSPQLLLSTHIKFSPYASRANRRAFVRDASERDLGVHLETALRGVIIGDRWPKSGVDVTITVLEAEEDGWWAERGQDKGIGGVGMMTVLAGCITVASAAMVEAGIDCVDTVTGGVAAIVKKAGGHEQRKEKMAVVDPCPSEHEEIIAACAVGYLPSRDEVTEMWMKGDVGSQAEELIDRSVDAASAVKSVLSAVLKESIQAKTADAESVAAQIEHEQDPAEKRWKGKAPAGQDVEMTS